MRKIGEALEDALDVVAESVWWLGMDTGEAGAEGEAPPGGPEGGPDGDDGRDLRDVPGRWARCGERPPDRSGRGRRDAGRFGQERREMEYGKGMRRLAESVASASGKRPEMSGKEYHRRQRSLFDTPVIVRINDEEVYVAYKGEQISVDRYSGRWATPGRGGRSYASLDKAVDSVVANIDKLVGEAKLVGERYKADPMNEAKVSGSESSKPVAKAKLATMRKALEVVVAESRDVQKLGFHGDDFDTPKDRLRFSSKFEEHFYEARKMAEKALKSVAEAEADLRKI